jgi:hypothetical protein
VERVLREQLALRGHHVEQDCRFVELTDEVDGVVAHVVREDQPEVIRARWIVGCDGGRSTMRTQAGLRLDVTTEPGKWIIGEFDMDWNVSKDVIYWNRHKLGSAVAYWDPETHKWHAWITTTDEALAPTIENFAERWATYTGRRVGITGASWIHDLRVNYGMAERFVVGRAILAGDAAHIHSSAGGQGLNTGVQDALNLGWKLALVVAGKAAPSLLGTYESERMAEARKVLALSNRMHKVMYPATAPQRFLSLKLLKAMRKAKGAERAAQRMSMLSINCRDSSLSRQATAFGNATSEAGCFVPDAVCRVGGVATQLFDILRGPSAELLLVAGDDPTPATMAALHRLARSTAHLAPDVRTHLVFASDADAERAAGPSASTIVDGAREVRRVLGLSGPEVLFVRPDGYIGHRSDVFDEPALFDYLGLIYGPTVLEETTPIASTDARTRVMGR